MKIYSMTATFGKLEHATLTLQPNLNIIEAPNEWGKSTWCAFLAAMLYGIDTRERTTAAALAVKERYAPWSGSPMQGRIDLCWNGRDITIERKSKGRTPFGDFRAYETGSGLPVAELTADNCGQLLLGVEKSVYTRTGFIRLSDMPVTQDEALRRRLNELVTTGDESGQSDDLAQKLRDLKNKVRSNRSNGLIPQALSEKTDLQGKLQQLDALQERSRQLKARQEQVTAFAAQLQNHKQALAYAAAQDYAQKAAAAKMQLAAAAEKTARLEEACRTLPTEEELLQQAAQARQLRQRRDDVQLELAMLCAPTPPAPAAHTLEQARQDYDAYCGLSAVQRPKMGIWAILSGAVAFVCGLGMVLLQSKPFYLPVGIAFMVIGAAFLAADLVGHARKNKAYKHAQELLRQLTGRYAPLAPEQWVERAQAEERRHSDYAASLSAFEAERTRLQNALQSLSSQLADLPNADGHSEALAQRRALADARREQATLQHLVDTLSSTGTTPEMPTQPDRLHYTEPETNRLLSDAEAEARLLHKQLGQLEGQMQALGSREALEAQLAAVSARLEKLEQTYAALELAQSKLAQASQALQRRFAPAIAKKAQEHFSRITAGRYDRLSLDNDLGVHTAAQSEDTLTSAQWRSDGTVDQLYLALRLAVADELTPNAPLVLDDALVRFDDERLGQAMALLRQISQHKQILLFTCQTREQLTMDS